MKRDPIWLTLLALALCDVAACALLGGTVKSPIREDCHDGTSCPETTFCTNYNTCEAAGGITEAWGDRSPDAGMQRAWRP